MSHRASIVLLATVAGATTLAAQERKPPETAPATWSISPEYREVQKSALETQRKLLLSFADSMPERLYRDKVTPAQRDFAQQIHHIAGSGAFVATWFLKGEPPKMSGDTAAVFNSRAGLKQFVNQQYDLLQSMLAAQSEDERNVRVKFFGATFIPKWQVWDELNQHAMWTAGQIVANFRKHGMAPPSFLFF